MKISEERLGVLKKKILLLLMAGATLSLTRRPDVYYRIVKLTIKEWGKINRTYLKQSIDKLYQWRLVRALEDKNGYVKLEITEKGKKRLLSYQLDNIEIPKPEKWDGTWRMVIFDIPDKRKTGRNALSLKLKNLGFYPLQKSVFVFPYPCKNEIDFIVEMYGLRPFVRYFEATNFDRDYQIKKYFTLK